MAPFIIHRRCEFILSLALANTVIVVLIISASHIQHPIDVRRGLTQCTLDESRSDDGDFKLYSAHALAATAPIKHLWRLDSGLLINCNLFPPNADPQTPA